MKARWGIGAFVSALALTCGVALAGVIPLDGAYGNAAGCQFFATGHDSDNMQLLTPDTFLSAMTGCDFEAAEIAADIYAVTGICSTPGQESISGEILKVRVARPGYVVVIDGLEAIGPLLPCVQILEQGVGI